MEKCKHCTKVLMTQEEQDDYMKAPGRRWSECYDLCDGILTLGPDPFQEEIHSDSTEYWQCQGERSASLMEI